VSATSFELGPPAPSPASVCVPPFGTTGGGGNTRLQVRGRGSQIGRLGRKPGTLYILSCKSTVAVGDCQNKNTTLIDIGVVHLSPSYRQPLLTWPRPINDFHVLFHFLTAYHFILSFLILIHFILSYHIRGWLPSSVMGHLIMWHIIRGEGKTVHVVFLYLNRQ
jgi:hypothetical protein